jgi:hypothetical protein
VLLSVTLAYGSRKIKVMLLLDIGASIITLHRQVAEQFDINESQKAMMIDSTQTIGSAFTKLSY